MRAAEVMCTVGTHHPDVYEYDVMAMCYYHQQRQRWPQPQQQRWMYMIRRQTTGTTRVGRHIEPAMAGGWGWGVSRYRLFICKACIFRTWIPFRYIAITINKIINIIVFLLHIWNNFDVHSSLLFFIFLFYFHSRSFRWCWYETDCSADTHTHRRYHRIRVSIFFSGQIETS